MKKNMPLEGLRWSRDSGSTLCDTPQNGRSRTGWGGGELFLPLYLAAVESHLFGFIRTKGKVDGFALITNLAFGILQSQVDGDDVATLTGKAPGRNLLQLYTHYIINRQISNAQRNQKYTFPIKTRGENYTFSMKIGVGNQTFPKKAVFYPYESTYKKCLREE